jgi:hypothetical protein
VRLAVRIGAAALLLLVLAVGATILYVDRVAEYAVERGATQALGVKTSLGSARVGLLSGTFRLRRLAVANPPGFDAEPFLTLRGAHLALDLASLRERTVEAPSLVLKGVVVRLERRRGKTNYGVILDNLSREERAQQPRAAHETAGKKFVIGELRIEDVTAQLKLLPQGGRLTELELAIPEIRLTQVGSGSDGLPVTELAGIVLKGVLEAVSRQGGSLPAGIGGDLQTSLRRLTRVPIGMPGSVPEAGGSSGGAVEELVGGAQRELEEGARKAVRGLGGLLKRDEEP